MVDDDDDPRFDKAELDDDETLDKQSSTSTDTRVEAHNIRFCEKQPNVVAVLCNMAIQSGPSS